MQIQSTSDALAQLSKQLGDERARSILAQVMVGQNSQVLTLALDTATDVNAPVVLGQFRSIWVADATDSVTKIFFRPNSKAAFNQGIPMRQNDVIADDYPFASGFIHWAAQAGKSVTLVLSSARIQPGSQRSTVTGATSSTSGSVIATQPVQTVGTVAAALLSLNLVRVLSVIQNQGTNSIWVGDLNVTIKGGTNPGIEIAPGAVFHWDNTAALWAVAASSNSNISVTSLT